MSDTSSSNTLSERFDRWLIRLIIFALVAFHARDVFAARLKDIVFVRGVRDNQLIGYGLVVGLAGTGDSKVEFTSKSMTRMLDSVGMKLESKDLSSKNVAAVLLTANLPPFAKSGNKIDITLNAIGDATSLEGGTLVQTPLRAANQQVYVVAQGSVLIGAPVGGKAFTTVARMPNGGVVERDVDLDFNNRKMLRLSLQNADFTTSARVTKLINEDLGGKYASSKDSGTIDVIVPTRFEGNTVEFLALLEGLEVTPDAKAKVIINEKTGTVVIGEHVRIMKVALSHGNLSVQVGASGANGPGGAGGGAKGKEQRTDRIFHVDGEANVGDLVKALNGLGVTPKDLITILQNIKAAGALQADLEIL